MYDSILVPTDGSREVEHALEYAFELAREHDAAIRTLYVVNAAGYGGLPMETALDGVSDALRGEGRRQSSGPKHSHRRTSPSRPRFAREHRVRSSSTRQIPRSAIWW